MWTSLGEAEAWGAGLELQTYWLPGLSAFSLFCPTPPPRPSCPPHTPQLSRTPRGGAPYIPRWDPTTRVPGMGFASASQGQGCQPSEGAPHHPLPLSRTTEEGSFIHPSLHVFFSHCDFALLPTHRGVGEELPRKHGLGQVLAFLTVRDSCRKEGSGGFSPTALFLPPPPSPQVPWLAPAPRASPPELWVRWVLPPPPHGKMSQASPQPPLLGPKPSGLELCKATELSRLSRTLPVGEVAFPYLQQSGSRPVGVSGRIPRGEGGEVPQGCFGMKIPPLFQLPNGGSPPAPFAVCWAEVREPGSCGVGRADVGAGSLLE